MELLLYYILSSLFFFVFFELILFIFGIKNINFKIVLLLRIIIYSLIVCYGLYLYYKIDYIYKSITFFGLNYIKLFSNELFYAFYNPVIPVINISLLQIFIIMIFSYTIIIIIEIIKNTTKKTLIILFLILLVGIAFRYNIPDNIWDTGYRDITYSFIISEMSYRKQYINILLNWDVLYNQINNYGIAFQDFLQFISKFTFEWKLKYTFIVNFILDLFNILLVFVLSKQLWKNNSLSLWNSLLYCTSIPILRFFSGGNLYVFGTTILLILLIFLFKFKDSEYQKKNYLIISILSCIILVYTHNIFILLPLLYPLFFLLFFTKKLFKKLFYSPSLIIFYLLSIIFIIPVLYIKTLGNFYISPENLNKIIKNISIFFDNIFSYLYVFLLTSYNPFLNSEINSYYIIFLLVILIIFYGSNKEDYKKILFFMFLYLILILPYSLSFLPTFPSLDYFDITKNLSYDNYKNYNGFTMLTDVMIKGSVTLFIFIIFSGNIIDLIQSLIKKDIIKKIYIVIISGFIISIPIINYEKIVYQFNVQKDFLFFYNNIDKILDKKTNYNIYYDTLWQDDRYYDEFNVGLELILKENKIRYTFYFIPDLKEKNISLKKDNIIYIASSSCFTKHNGADFNGNCIINNKHKNITFIPLLENEIICNTYDIESYCIKDKIKIGIYKVIKQNNEKAN